VTSENARSWDLLSSWYQANAGIPTESATYGAEIPDEDELRLCGDVSGKRVLDLGCGGAQSAIAFARHGAKVIGIDHSAEQLSYARRLAEAEEVKLELRQADLADLAFLPPGSVDLAFSAWALNYVSDVSRVFRQVHRVLKTGAPFVFSLPHPAIRLIARSSEEPLLVRRSYWDRQPITWTWHDGVPLTEYQHTIADLYGGLQRANFAVDTILEPEPTPTGPRSMHWHEANQLVPVTLVMRARKVGL
jgi:SAM-dependent methyltransferase